MHVNRLAACIIVTVMVAVVVYVWFQETSATSSAKKSGTNSKSSTRDTKSAAVDEREEIKEEEDEDEIDDGIIKFECELSTGHIEFNSIQKLLQARNKLHDLGLIDVYKHNNIGFGNMSQRIDSHTSDKDITKVPFYITGTQTSGISTADMNESHFSMVHNYDIPQNKLFCSGAIRASSESMTHAAVYELDERIKCVVHVHNHLLWKQAMDKLPTTDKNIPYGTPEMAKEVERLYKDNVGNLQQVKVFVMGGHQDGLIAFGESIDAATNLMIEIYQKYGGDETESNEEEESVSTPDNILSLDKDSTMNVNIIDDYATPVSQPVNNEANVNAKNGGFVQVETDQLTL